MDAAEGAAAGERLRAAEERARRAEEALEAFKGTNWGKGEVGEVTAMWYLMWVQHSVLAHYGPAYTWSFVSIMVPSTYLIS